MTNLGSGLHLPDDVRQQMLKVCHDLRQPIATIAMLADVALTSSDLSDTVQTRLHQIIAESHRMSELVGTLMSANRHKQALDGGQIAQEVVTALGANFGGSIELSKDADLRFVADADRVAAALHELIDEAMRRAGRDGRVLVRVRRTPEQVCFEIADNRALPADLQGNGAIGQAPSAAEVAAEHGGIFEVATSAELGGALFRLGFAAVESR